MKLKNMIANRIARSIYMGFLLDKKANLSIGATYKLSKENLDIFSMNFNNATDLSFNRITIDFDDCGAGINTCGNTYVYLNENNLNKLIGDIEDMINSNLTRVVQSGKRIQVFDLNTLEELERTGVTTMGDKYRATNQKRYIVSFMHLYSVAKIY